VFIAYLFLDMERQTHDDMSWRSFKKNSVESDLLNLLGNSFQFYISTFWV